jgi:hypothetical protein
MNIQDALYFYNKDLKAEYTVGEDYESLIWHSVSIPKPSYEELLNAYIAFLEYKNSTRYKELRKEAYPSIEDQLDLIFHGGLEAWREVIQDVKNRYPK